MEFTNQDEETGMPSSSLGYNHPPILRASAFSRPTLSPSSSLISPRVGVGGVVSSSSRNNGNIFAAINPTPPPPPPPPPLTLSSAPESVDHSSSSQSPPKSPEPAPAPSDSSPNSWPTTATVKSSTTTAADVSVRYRECLRNHAALIGGHVLDGCGDFMPDGAPGTPEALKCAACGCHRSFHRKEADGDTTNAASSFYRAAAAGGGGFGGSASRMALLPPPHPQSHHHPNPHTPRQFQLSGFSSSPSGVLPGSSGFVVFGANTSGSGGTTTESSSEERINVAALIPSAAPRKRFRTKFTGEQKEKMLAFAERIGWRIQKQDESAVEQFCAEIGVRRQVLKVWMHNNKHIIKKHQQQLPENEQMQEQPHRQQPQSHQP